MGSGNVHDAYYAALPANHYKFRVRGLDVMGAWTGGEASIHVFVPEPFWKTPWFWAVALVAIVAMVMGASRYFVWQRMRHEMARLKQQRALEQERLRIAHDIHDDLGARVTQISLLSAMAQENPTFPEKARADFDKVSKMSRELVSALYETVWAVNPENDNLEALGNYVCQMVKQLCEQTPLRCRFHVMDLPHEVQVSSQTRHNISMAVKEAVHNIIKHAKASEVTVRMVFADGSLEVTVHDDGAGFQPVDSISGHGLSNMKQRLQNIGGTCTVESKPGGGTTVRLRLRIETPVPGA
jgi:signal transduction histidine kinase